jgi:hypothetical protein
MSVAKRRGSADLTMDHAPAAPIGRHGAHQAPIRYRYSVALTHHAGDERIDFPFSIIKLT